MAEENLPFAGQTYVLGAGLEAQIAEEDTSFNGCIGMVRLFCMRYLQSVMPSMQPVADTSPFFLH